MASKEAAGPPKQAAKDTDKDEKQKVYRADLGESFSQAPPQTATDNEER